MILRRAKAEVVQVTSFAMQLVEQAGRICYRSENKIREGSALGFLEARLRTGHESIFEHASMTAKFITNRATSHELVRHRIVIHDEDGDAYRDARTMNIAVSQESQRYCNYKGGVEFIIPPWVNIAEGEYRPDELIKRSDITESQADWDWFCAMMTAERAYTDLIKEGWKPQQARTVLPNATKTEAMLTSNIREWRHLLRVRTADDADIQMREIMIPILGYGHERYPVFFGDIPLQTLPYQWLNS